MQACAINTDEEIRETIKEETEVDEQLLTAARRGEMKIVADLIENHADLNVRDDEGRTALMIAVYNEDAEMAEILLDAGANVDLQDNMKNNPFLYAGAEGYLDILKLAIAAHADPAIRNRYGGTALIPASERGHLAIIEEILNQTEVDINHVNNLGWTALMEAVILNDGGETQQQVVQLLIDHGADATIPDNDHITPLQHARAKGFTEIEQILLKAEAK
ncbi:hypothetical protein CSV77_14235 [Sporosarcina sp. P16b]|uniref:ankyrin repeat domain-containing protein n=1 Tax=Sporosarcina sp. P16b TaxID=2048261 RepID=UPI000C16987D|nr:ankyrin repeat domain-containing protein [Sporosarcina sp. P16b]PIC69359.1 hypothetical protein CSV77_14235 [Sporosarcina sp. P16b]